MNTGTPAAKSLRHEDAQRFLFTFCEIPYIGNVENPDVKTFGDNTKVKQASEAMPTKRRAKQCQQSQTKRTQKMS